MKFQKRSLQRDASDKPHSAGSVHFLEQDCMFDFGFVGYWKFTATAEKRQQINYGVIRRTWSLTRAKSMLLLGVGRP